MYAQRTVRTLLLVQRRGVLPEAIVGILAAAKINLQCHVFPRPAVLSRGPRSRSRIGVRYLRRHGPGACWRQSAAGNSTSAMCEDLLGLMGNEWERDEPRAADWVAREGS
jgi:hypothetical protein